MPTLGSTHFSGTNGQYFSLQLDYSYTQNTPNNTTTITYTLYFISNGGSAWGSSTDGYINSVSVGSTTGISRNDTITLGTLTETITHNNDGTFPTTSYSASMSPPWSKVGSASLSGELTSTSIPKINRASTWGSSLLSIPNIESAFTLPINKYVGAYYNVVELRNSNNTILVKTINDAYNGQSITLNSTELSTIYTMDNNANQLPLRFFMDLKTYTNSTKTSQVGATQRLTCEAYLVNSEPTLSFTKEETDANVLEVFGGQPSVVIKYASDLLYTITATPKHGATITNVKVDGNNATLDSGNTYTITLSTSVDNIPIVITDSRGYTTTQNDTFTLVDYVEPNINSGWEIERESPVSSNLVLNATIDAYNDDLTTNITNSVDVKYSIDNTNWTTISSSSYTYADNKITISNLALSNIIPYNQSATFYLKATDLLEETNDSNVVSVGIETFSYGERDVQVNGDLIVCDEDGENPTNILDGLNTINSSLIEESTTYIPVTQSTDNQLLWQKSLNKGMYLFVCNLGLNYYGANGRDLFTYLYLDGTQIDVTDGVINVSAYSLYRPVIKIVNVTSNYSTLRFEVKSSSGNYLVNTSQVQMIRLK